MNCRCAIVNPGLDATRRSVDNCRWQVPARRSRGASGRLQAEICKMLPGEIAPELTGHGLPLGKCEAYNRVYDQPYESN
jgi:hypothetical protein